MVHGGIRYLQHGDLYRVRESSAERSSLLRVAPHLVRPLPIVVPTYKGLMRGKTAMRAALSLYVLLTFDRNRGIPDPINRIPRGRIISRNECLELFPELDSTGLTGAALFHDGQMYNPTRLALCFLGSAVEAGAVAANYVEVTSFLRDGDRVIGVTAKDRPTGNDLEVRGRIVVNAAGAWAVRLLEDTEEVRLDPRPTFSRDACFVVPRRLAADVALAIQGATEDPDALMSRGARHLFLVPWRSYTLVGVWHVVYEGDPDRVTVTEDDLGAFLNEVNSALPGLRLTLDDVHLWNAGLVLFGENRPGARDLSYGKRSMVVDHARADRLEGLITVIGVRYTTARGVAARAVDLVFRKTGRRPTPSTTDTTVLHGGDFASFDSLVREATSAKPHPLEERLAVALLRNYGTRYEAVLRLGEADPRLLDPIGGSTTLRAEVLHATREEMAVRLGDVVLRRTDLGTGEHPGAESLRLCAELMAAELGWDADRVAAEIRDVQSRYMNASA
jgi:glycerol-3-phosphate dehydrogenase